MPSVSLAAQTDFIHNRRRIKVFFCAVDARERCVFMCGAIVGLLGGVSPHWD